MTLTVTAADNDQPIVIAFELLALLNAGVAHVLASTAQHAAVHNQVFGGVPGYDDMPQPEQHAQGGFNFFGYRIGGRRG